MGEGNPSYDATVRAIENIKANMSVEPVFAPTETKALPIEIEDELLEEKEEPQTHNTEKPFISDDEKEAIRGLVNPADLEALRGTPVNQAEEVSIQKYDSEPTEERVYVEEEHEADKTLKQRIKDFISEHKFTIIGAAIATGIVIAGVTIYSMITNDTSAASMSADGSFIQTISDQLTSAISQHMPSGDEITHITEAVQNTDPNAVQAFDPSVLNEGTDVSTTLQGALDGSDIQQANEWMQVDHIEAVDQAGNVIDLDGKSADEMQQIFDNGDYGIRGSQGDNYMGWFSEDTIMDKARGGR